MFLIISLLFVPINFHAEFDDTENVLILRKMYKTEYMLNCVTPAKTYLQQKCQLACYVVNALFWCHQYTSNHIDVGHNNSAVAIVYMLSGCFIIIQ